MQTHPELKLAVDQVLADKRSVELDCEAGKEPFCADQSPLLYLGRMNLLKQRHHAALLDIGEDSLRARLHLMRAAQKTIEIQNFLFRRDQSGALFMHELIQAAKRGVKVRVMFDQLFTVSELNYLAGLALQHKNFEVRLYNPLFNNAKTTRATMFGGVVCCFTKTNQRMHSKLQIVDGLVGLTGGRNIADRYFDYDTDYNFKDREVLVYGPVVAEMEVSFDLFWNSTVTAEIGHLRDIAPLIVNDLSAPLDSFKAADRFAGLLSDIENNQLMHRLFVHSAHDVDAIKYFYDLPHDLEDRVEFHATITDGMHAVLAGAQQSLVIQSPYLVLSKRSRRLFKTLNKQRPELDLVFSTNSLAATDAYSAYAITHKHKKHYINALGFQLYEFRPYPADIATFFPRLPALIAEKERGVDSGKIPAIGPNPAAERSIPRTGMHSKSFVIDGHISMVGSHNLDPRGEGFNTENGVIIYDDGFAAELEKNIRKDILPGNSWVVAMKPKPRILAGLNSAIESTSRSLPIFDIWPYRSTSLYELKANAVPAQAGTAAFYENYQAVGSFPEVVVKKRRWQVIMISSFMGFIRPVL